MTPESQRIAIAEVCPNIRSVEASVTGSVWQWTSNENHTWVFCNQNDPLLDLNAMHEAEKVLSAEQRASYGISLFRITGGEWQQAVSATASQRAEAFLRTLRLWKEEPVSEATVEGLR